MKKKDVVEAVLLALQDEFRSLMEASQEVRNAAGDEEMKAESQYDTQSTEANYLADGQARHAAEVEEAAAAFEGVDFREFDPGEPVEVGALVQLRVGGEEGWFLFAPAAGGTEVEVGGQEITVITPEAPLGAALAGRKAGERIETPAAEVLSVG